MGIGCRHFSGLPILTSPYPLTYSKMVSPRPTSPPDPFAIRYFTHVLFILSVYEVPSQLGLAFLTSDGSVGMAHGVDQQPIPDH